MKFLEALFRNCFQHLFPCESFDGIKVGCPKVSTSKVLISKAGHGGAVENSCATIQGFSLLEPVERLR